MRRATLKYPGPAIIILALVACAAPPGSSVVDRGAASCPADGWTEPRTLASPDGRPYYVEAPSTVVLANGVALFGVPTFRWESPEVLITEGAFDERFAGLLMGRDSTTLIPLPAGVPYMLDPLAVSDERGGAHVLWGTSAATTRSFGNKVTGIAYSHFDGAHWTAPEQVLSATDLTWAPKSRDAVVRDGVLHVVAAGYDTVGGEVKIGSVLVSKRPDATVVTWQHLGAFVGYMTLSRGADGRLLEFLTTSLDTGREQRVYGLYAVREGDQGQLGKASLVRAFGDDVRALWPQTVRLGRVHHVFWVEEPLSTPLGLRTGSSKVMHASYSDDARTLTMGEPLELPYGTDGLEVATMDSTILIAVRTPATSEIGIVQWRAGRWGAVRHPFREPSLARSVFVETGVDSVQLTWGMPTPGAVPLAPTYPAPRQRIAVLRRRCLEGRSSP